MTKINPFDADSMDDAAMTWAHLVEVCKQHIRDVHNENPDDLYAKYLLPHSDIFHEEHAKCPVHDFVSIDACAPMIVSMFTIAVEEGMPASHVVQRFDQFVAATRYLLQAELWDIENGVYPDAAFGEVQGNA